MKPNRYVGKLVRLLCQEKKMRIKVIKSSKLRRWIILCWMRSYMK